MGLSIVSFKNFLKCTIQDVSENNIILGRDIITWCNMSNQTWYIKHFYKSHIAII